MIPLRDNIPSRTVPVVNYAVIAVCTLVFLLQLATPRQAPSLVERYGMIPARITHPDRPVEIVVGAEVVMTNRGPEQRVLKREAAPSAVPPVLTMFTCIFLHGGWMHFLGNMLFLYIFGDNVEDRFGHVGYALFYAGCGVAASASHYLTAINSPVPTIGASGAIAGVLGAYFVSYPKAKVLMLLILFPFLFEMVVLPAPVFLGLWFAIQFFQGAISITGEQTTGVAWWAHIGGFAVGAGAVWSLGKTGLLRPVVHTILPRTDHVQAYRVHADGRPW